MSFPRPLVACLAIPVALGGIAGAGCQTSPAASTYSPYQGINIDSTSLVAPFGCGMGPDEVYRYVATVRELPAAPDGGPAAGDAATVDAGPGPVLASGIFDCFVDGVFEGLPTAPASLLVTIYAFNFAESAAAGFGCEAGASSCVPPTLDSGAAPSGYSWTTTCTGSVEAAASIIASCKPLAAVGSSSADAAAPAPVDGATMPTDAAPADGATMPTDATPAPVDGAAGD